MDINRIINNLVPGASFNPACVNFTESQARDKKLWRDTRKMPTQSEIEAEHDRLVIEDQKVEYIEKRKEKLKEDIGDVYDLMQWLFDDIKAGKLNKTGKTFKKIEEINNLFTKPV